MEITNLTISSKKSSKDIINNLSFSAKKGELLAIIGPSGSGKTTIADFLSGEIRSDFKYKGDCKIQGIVRYVSQDITLHTFYTVREYLNIYLRLNYGRSITNELIREIIDDIANETGMTSALDTKVGDIFKKNLSEGEKRRLSIALELISKPDILILDEATSDVDSCSAFQIIQILKKVARSGVAVICTLHQPSSEIWEALDKILLISGGTNCYEGDIKGAESFFNYLGKPLPQNYNPAEFFLMHIHPRFVKDLVPADLNKKYLEWKEKPKDYTISQNNENIIKKSDFLEKLQSINGKASSGYKYLYLCKRTLQSLIKNPMIFWVRLITYLLTALVIGLMYLGIEDKLDYLSVIARASLLAYVMCFLVFMSIAILPTFLIERLVLQKELRNNLYYSWQYQLAYMTVTYPGIMILALISSIVIISMAKLHGFGLFFIFLFLTLTVAEAFTRTISLLVPNFIIGMAVASSIYAFFILCCGFLRVKADIPGTMIWGYYISFHTYAFQALMYNELIGIKNFQSFIFDDGAEVLDYFSMRETDLGANAVILISFFIFFELCSWILTKLRYSIRFISNRTIVKSI